MTVAELIHLLELYPPTAFVQIDCTGPDRYDIAFQVVQEALNAIVIHTEHNRLKTTYLVDGITPREEKP